jgi:hypothetical protein
MLVWQSYQTDLGRAYPMLALNIAQINDVPTSINPVDLLPNAISNELMRVRNPCTLDQLMPRSIVLFASDGASFRLSYPRPFSESLFDYLTVNPDVAAFEFIGERIKYGRLRKLLENV